MRLAVIFWKNVFLIACTPPSPQSHIYWPSPPTFLGPFLRAIWNAASQAIVLILPQIKFDSQLSHCAFFSVDSCKRNKFVFYVSHCVLGSFCHSCLIFTLNNTGPTWRNPMLRSISSLLAPCLESEHFLGWAAYPDCLHSVRTQAFPSKWALTLPSGLFFNY